MFWKSKTPWHRSSPETLPPLPPAEALSPPLDSEVQFYLRRASGGCFVLFVLYFFVQAKVPDLLGMLRWLPPRDGIRMLGTEHIMLGCLTFFSKKRVTFCVISSCLVYLVISWCHVGLSQGLLSNGSHAAGKLLLALDKDGFDRTAPCTCRLLSTVHICNRGVQLAILHLLYLAVCLSYFDAFCII